MDTLFLVNPGSGRKRDAHETIELIHKMYQEADRPVETRMINFDLLDQTLEEAIASGVKYIFAVGGDGTVNAIGSRLVDKPVAFGIIPKGSGNGYARNLGYSINTRLAIKQSIDASPLLVDTGTFNDIPFLNVAGVGLDAEVAQAFSQRKRRGFVSYVQSSAEKILSYQPQNYRMIIDGVVKEFDDILGVAVANGTQWGYDAKVSSGASITDGVLDLLVLHRFPLIKVGLIVGKMFNGQFHDSRYVEFFQARAIDIFREDEGYAQIDGEPFSAGKQIRIRTKEKNLSLLLPNTLTEKKIDQI
jgi:diacylglycerol kinase (ATP)